MAETIYESCREAALEYAKKGWRVIPLHSPQFDVEGRLIGCSCKEGANCKQTGKHPRTLHGLKDATTDANRIALWWEQWPGANVGIVTGGESNLAVIDLDGDEGKASWARIEAKHGEVFTLQARTGGDGLHLLFNHPGVTIKNRTGILPGVDVRGDGGYIVAAGSVHKSGKFYEWLTDVQPASMPVFLLDWLIGDIDPFTGEDTTAGKGGVIEPPANPVDQMKARLNGDFSAYAKAAFKGEVASVRNAGEGTRNATLNRAAFKLGQFIGAGVLDRAEVEAALANAAEAAGLEGDEVTKTLNSGLEAGMGKPRDMAKVEAKAKPAKAAATAEGNDDEAAGGKKIPPTHGKLADRWISEHPDTAYGLGDWRRYANGYWEAVDQAEIEKEILAEVEAAEAEGVRTTAGIMDSVRRLAAVKVGVQQAKWDADADIIVCQNGTLHIPTMTLREWKPEDFATSAVDYNYDPAATCPVFLRVLRESLPDAMDFLQEYAGVCLTTATETETAVWLTGEPGGGKSTVVAGFQAALGKGKWTTLSLSDIENGRFALARLPGKTLAISTEQPTGLLRATDILNRIISGEPVTVEQKFKPAWDFVPKAKLLWAMNELPRVPDANNGLFRRVKIIEVPSIPKDKRDPKVKLAVMSEGAGILNWALEGLHRFRRNGCFTIPASVETATEDFKQNNDVAALFVDECCTTGEDMKAKASQLFSIYNQWAKDNNHGAKSSTRFSEDMKRLGFRKGKYNGNPHYYGVGVRADVPYLP